MNEEQTVHCGIHGLRRAAFVCQHLLFGSGLGFFAPDDPGANLQGWCEECERVRLRCGGWNDESERFAGVTFVCDMCYAAARERNSK